MTARLLLSMVTLVGAVAAQSDPQIRAAFERLDRNGDGALGRNEFPGSDRQFRGIDTNGNRRISPDELEKSAFGKLLRRARQRNQLPPRPRQDLDLLALRRLEQLARFDPNRDGKITKKEWRGAPAALLAMDLDGDGDADKRDLKLARERVPGGVANPLAAIDKNPADAQKILDQLDRNGDDGVDARELRGQEFASLLAPFDRNGNQRLEIEELTRMVGAIRTYLARRDAGRGKMRAFLVPFSTWDKNKDGRLESGEWLQRGYLFPRYDRNRDGGVTKDEVERFTKIYEGNSFIERFDLNGDRAVTAAEYAGAFEVFGRMDRNGDGVVNAGDR